MITKFDAQRFLGRLSICARIFGSVNVQIRYLIISNKLRFLSLLILEEETSFKHFQFSNVLKKVYRVVQDFLTSQETSF